MKFKLEVYTPELKLVGILEIYKSLLIENWAFDSGSFTLESLIDDRTRELLVPNNIIWFDEDMAGIIEYVYKESVAMVTTTIKGSLLKGILDYRILWGLYNLKGNTPELMRYLVTDNAISPTRGDPIKRKIPHLVLVDDEVELVSRLPEIRIQKTGGSLLEALSELGGTQKVFFNVGFNAEVPQMEFFTRIGLNRTIHQTEVEPVFFGTELDDILKSSYTYNSQDYRTSALVAGEGEGSNRVLLEVFEEGKESLSGLKRREMWVDARDLQSTTVGGESLTPTEYRELLKTRGKEKLSERQLVQNFDATMRTKNSTYTFNKDFFLGDTITAIDRRLGIVVDALVEGVEYSVIDGREDLVLTFGYSSPTPYDRLRKVGI